jgi:GNAT superfamily N-acetyltransferase
MSTTYPLTTLILPCPSLSQSPHLPALAALLNRTFTHTHVHGAGYEILPASVGRLQKPEQLASELGSEGFCIIAFSAAAGGRMVGTASAKPYHADKAREGAGGEVNLIFKRPAAAKGGGKAVAVVEDEEGLPAWELLAMAVEPELQGKGISSQLLEVTLEEIKRRVAEGGERVEGTTRVLVSTMKELTEGYYHKKGWETTEERRFPPGTAGSGTGFTVVEMVRMV